MHENAIDKPMRTEWPISGLWIFSTRTQAQLWLNFSLVMGCLIQPIFPFWVLTRTQIDIRPPTPGQINEIKLTWPCMIPSPLQPEGWSARLSPRPLCSPPSVTEQGIGVTACLLSNSLTNMLLRGIKAYGEGQPKSNPFPSQLMGVGTAVITADRWGLGGVWIHRILMQRNVMFGLQPCWHRGWGGSEL